MGNRIFFLCLIAIAAVQILGSCEKNMEDPAYVGTMKVIYEGEEYVTENARVRFIDKGNGTADLELLKMKFVPAMPVRVDVAVRGLTSEKKEDGSTFFSGTGIIPTSLNIPQNRFKVTGLEGTLSGGHLAFSLKFGEYPTSFEGDWM